jgi:hypothetical protein
MTVQPNLSLLASQKKVLGHGDFKYTVDPNWGNLDPAKVPVSQLPRDGDGSKGANDFTDGRAQE